MLTILDLVVFVAYFAVVLVIGLLAGTRKHDTLGGYFRGNNQLAWYTIGMSIVAAGVSSEQFVGEAGYAYKIGMPVANWEWLVLPSLGILLWIFVPLYVRERVTTMPEYLERRYGETARTLFAWLSIASFVFVNFAMTFYAGGLAMEQTWGINKFAAVVVLAVTTGIYTIYGGLTAVAWTSSLQCVLLMGGGLLVFFAGMARIDWNFAAVLGAGQQAHLITSTNDSELPWTALIILMLSTNVWYYATNQYINQRCLAARNEWHAKMGVLLAGGLQVLLPLATCFPGMIFRVINPDLQDSNTAYPDMVAAVVPVGFAGLVAAAIMGAIMSTVSGLMNSTSTIMTIDIAQRSFARDWPEAKLVRFGRWSAAVALLIGILVTPIIIRWESMFRYAQDIWAPMAAPTVAVFLTGALWRGARERGAVVCLWLAIFTVPFTLVKSILETYGVYFLPANLQNSMVAAAPVGLIAFVAMLVFTGKRSWLVESTWATILSAIILAVATWSMAAVTILLTAAIVGTIGVFVFVRRAPQPDMWDRSMLTGVGSIWYTNVWIWWLLLSFGLGSIYWLFW